MAAKKVTIRLSLVFLMASMIMATAVSILAASTLFSRNSINWVIEALAQKVAAHVIDKSSVTAKGTLDIPKAAEGIRTVHLSENGKIFLLNSEFTILASAEYKNDIIEPDRFMNKNLSVEKTHDPLLEKSFERFLKNEKKKDRKIKMLKRKFDHFPFWYKFHKYLSIYKDFKAPDGKEYYIAVVFPFSDFFKSITRNNIILYGLAVIFVLISIVVSLRISKRISKPLAELAEETERIRNFDLDSENNPESFLVEVENMAGSIARMRSGLRSFKKYVPADLVKELIHQGKEAFLGGEKKVLTVFFSDIAGFTTVSEKLPPEELVKFLSEYLGTMTKIIHDYRGTVDKYIGDAIMAFWGAPIDFSDHSTQACHAALKFQEIQEVMRKKAMEAGNPDFFSRIGINTGELIVGNMGYEDRMNYTVIGDTVNLASRIEGINKNYGTRILIGEQTYAEIHTLFETRFIDIVAVKGKEKGVKLYELIGPKGSLNPSRAENKQAYEKALGLYLQKDFKSAKESFASALKAYPDDLASKVFMERCDKLMLSPPPAGWSGVFVASEK